MQKEVSLEAVEKLMEETAEAAAYQKEISQLLRGNLTEADDQELETELEDLIAAQPSDVPGLFFFHLRHLFLDLVMFRVCSL